MLPAFRAGRPALTMNDATGRKLEARQRVVFSVGTKLVFGTIVDVRDGHRYGRDFEIAKIRLDIPEARQRRRRGRYEYDAAGNWRFIPDNPNEADPPPRTVRDVYEQNRICILDPVKEDLTNQ